MPQNERSLTNRIKTFAIQRSRPILWVSLVLSGCIVLFRVWIRKFAATPSELRSLVYFALFYKRAKIPKAIGDDLHFCFQSLSKVSRSFSAVILELTPTIRDPICVFYLVLRGLDTIEDDMSIPVNKKIQILKSFPSRLDQPGWNSREGYGASNPDEQKLLEHFDRVISVYSKLKPADKSTIKDITTRMSDGMIEYLEKKVISCQDYEKYCHYVAGLVGIGLSKLFHHSGLEGSRFANLDQLSNSMGLFLQKTNIIRDYFEDIKKTPPRVFYPKEIWSKYVGQVEDMKNPNYIGQATQCLNEMVTDALKHIPDCLDYLRLVQDPTIFKFCAVPQVMAIATLERCYNNPLVFSSCVKIRKGEAVHLVMDSTNYRSVCSHFKYYLNALEAKIPPTSDPVNIKTRSELTRLHRILSDNRLI